MAVLSPRLLFLFSTALRAVIPLNGTTTRTTVITAHLLSWNSAMKPRLRMRHRVVAHWKCNTTAGWSRRISRKRKRSRSSSSSSSNCCSRSGTAGLQYAAKWLWIHTWSTFPSTEIWHKMTILTAISRFTGLNQWSYFRWHFSRTTMSQHGRRCKITISN